MICLMKSRLTHCLNPDFDLLFPRNMEEKEISDSMLFWNKQFKKMKRAIYILFVASNQYKITCYLSIYD